MEYKGEIIEESLRDKGVLDRTRIVNTRVEAVTERHETPWLKQWTLHDVVVADHDAADVARAISDALQPSDWYADYKNDKSHYIIFPNEVFVVDRSQPEQYRDVVRYGLGLGIPRHQLEFVPGIEV